MTPLIKETLEKQLQILSERSTRERGEILPDLTQAMLSVANYLEKEPSKELKNVIADEVEEQMDGYGARVLDDVTKACIETYDKVSTEFVKSFDDATNLRDKLRQVVREEIKAAQQSTAKEG